MTVLFLESQCVFRSQEVTENAELFILAGFETTANTLTFCIYMLAKHPEWQDRLAADISAAVQTTDNLITPEFLQNMPPLLDAVINETLRLYPVGSMIRRTIDEDIQVGLYTIPKVLRPCLYFQPRFTLCCLFSWV